MSYRTGPGVPRSLSELWQFVRRECGAIQREAVRVDTKAQNALEDLTLISDDGKLHPNEKLQVVLRYAQLTGEQSGLEARADSFGITTEKTAYTTAISDLTDYLDGLNPLWTDATQVTPIDRAEWDGYWVAATDARQALQNKISERAGEEAKWSGIADDNGKRPADSATRNIIDYDELTGEFDDNGTLIGTMQSVRKAQLRAQQASASVFFDAFTDTAAVDDWPIVAGNSSSNIYYVKEDDSGAISGGNILRIGGTLSTDLAADGEGWVEFCERFPFDPEKLYRLKARVWVGNEGDTDRQLAIGVHGFRSDGSRCRPDGDPGIGAHYIAAHFVQAAGDGWQEYAGYFKGHGASAGEWSTALGGNSIASPAKLHPEVRSFAPVAAANYPARQGRTQFDYFRIDEVEPSGHGAYLQINTNSGLGADTSPGEAFICGFDAAGNPDSSLPFWWLCNGAMVATDPVQLNPSQSGLWYIIANKDGYKWGGTESVICGKVERGQWKYRYYDGSTTQENASWNPGPDDYIIGEMYFDASESIKSGGLYQNPRPVVGFANYLSGLNEKGRAADQRTLMQTVGSMPSVITSSALSASDNGTSAKITIAAHTVQYDFGTLSYNAGSISGLAFSQKYHVYCDDENYQGGSVTYYATASLAVVASSGGRRYIGTLTTPADGGGTTIPPNEECVASGMWLLDDLLVDDAQAGDLIDVWDIGDSDSAKGPIDAIRPAHNVECVRITMESGAEVVCSVSTPVTGPGPDNEVRNAPDALGMQLGVLHDNEPLVWERVVSVEPVGTRTVYHLSCGNISFAAGADPAHRVITHNIYYKP